MQGGMISGIKSTNIIVAEFDQTSNNRSRGSRNEFGMTAYGLLFMPLICSDAFLDKEVCFLFTHPLVMIRNNSTLVLKQFSE